MRSGIRLVTLASLAIATACWVMSPGKSPGTEGQTTPACPALPEGFRESHLTGTWMGEEFGNIDRLILRDDRTYKQIHDFYYTSSADFESDWQRWYIDQDSDAHIRLHLVGMRRCDSIESICNNPGGGVPSDTAVLNPCSPLSLTYPPGEVILFVTGSRSDVPRGIMLQVPRLAGSEFWYTYSLEE